MEFLELLLTFDIIGGVQTLVLIAIYTEMKVLIFKVKTHHQRLNILEGSKDV